MVSFHSCWGSQVHNTPMMVFSLAEYIILFCGGLQTLGFLRHVRPSIVRIDPRSKCANRRHANPTPRTGCVLSMQRVYMGDARPTVACCSLKLSLTLRGARWRSRGPLGPTKQTKTRATWRQGSTGPTYPLPLNAPTTHTTHS